MEQLYVSMVSLLKNNPQAFVHFYIVSSDFSERSKKAISTLPLLYENADIHYLTPDINLFQDMPITLKHISVETYFRYLLAEMAPELEKALYLDADVVVDGDLAALWDMDLRDCYFAGAEDYYIKHIGYKKKIGLSEDNLYVNAGVLLLNLRKMREEKLGDHLLAISKKLAGKILYQDQDVLNIVCQGRIAEFDMTYNYTSFNAYKHLLKGQSPRIIHFCGGLSKPWNKDCNHPLRHKYLQYYLTAPFSKIGTVVEQLAPARRPQRRKYYLFGIPVAWVRDYITHQDRYLFGIKIRSKMRYLTQQNTDDTSSMS